MNLGGIRRVARSSRVLAGCALLAVLVTGCAATVTPANPGDESASPPMPAGVLVGQAALASSGSNGSNDCGDPTASLPATSPLPTPGQMPSGTTMAAIQQRGYLIAGVDQGTYLFGYLNPKTNTLEGFDIDMVHAIAQAIFGDPNKVQFRAITSAQRIPSLTNADGAPQVDVVVRTMTIDCQREQSVFFSTVYYNAEQRVLVDKGSGITDIDQLGGKKVCAAVGSDSLQHIAAVSTHPIPVAAQDWPDCLVMLEQGQVDAVSTDDTILAGMAAQDPNTEVVGPGFYAEPYGIAMRKGSPDFVSFVNGVLNQVRAPGGVWDSSYAKWLQPYIGGGVPSPPTPQYTSGS